MDMKVEMGGPVVRMGNFREEEVVRFVRRANSLPGGMIVKYVLGRLPGETQLKPVPRPAIPTAELTWKAII
jgi:hypothetical protein